MMFSLKQSLNVTISLMTVMMCVTLYLLPYNWLTLRPPILTTQQKNLSPVRDDFTTAVRSENAAQTTVRSGNAAQTTVRSENDAQTTVRSGNAAQTTVRSGNVTQTTVQQGNVTHLKKILLWNTFFGKKDFNFGTGQQPFLDEGCPVNTCNITYDRNLFKMEELDALIWHARSGRTSLPAVRSPRTQYVFLTFESPANLQIDWKHINNAFNLTMTYRRDADFFTPYGRLERLQKSNETEEGVITNYAQGKTKMAAWFVSNCKTKSNRDKLVSRLQKYIDVDVYGRCGPLKCPREETTLCYDMLSSDYFFYFAFENSLCHDYVTEKFFKAARYNVIPVVYGLASYAEIAPNHSYIDVLDFDSVKDLADHLTYLSKNTTAYNEYFQWKKDYRMIVGLQKHSWCLLCEKLHEESSPKTYDIHKWYYVDDACLTYKNKKFSKLFH